MLTLLLFRIRNYLYLFLMGMPVFLGKGLRGKLLVIIFLMFLITLAFPLGFLNGYINSQDSIVHGSSFLARAGSEQSEAFVADSGVADSDWPMFHHDLAHTGYSPSLGPNTNNSLWNYNDGNGYVRSSPAVVDGKIYVGSYNYNVYCINATDGLPIWSYPTGNAVYLSSPAVVDGRVYVGSNDNKTYCLNANNGALLWSFATGDKVYSSPAVVNDKVYVGSFDNKVYCLNASTGVLIWSYTTLDDVESSPAVVNGKVYVGSNDNYLYCLNADSGALIRRYRAGWRVISCPAVVDGRVYVGSDGVYCFDAESDALLWKSVTFYTVSSPAVANGKVYIGSFDKNVYCLNAYSGALIWNYTTGDEIYDSAPAFVDGKIYVGSNDGKLYCFNADNGTVIWSYIIGSLVTCSPAIVDGKLYVGSEGNGFYCFGDVSPKPTLRLSVEHSQPTLVGGQALTFDVTVFNQLNPELKCTLILTISGPNGYYLYDFQPIDVATDSVKDYSFNWNIPDVAGKYVPEVGLVPAQVTAYDVLWLKVN